MLLIHKATVRSTYSIACDITINHDRLKLNLKSDKAQMVYDYNILFRFKII